MLLSSYATHRVYTVCNKRGFIVLILINKTLRFATCCNEFYQRINYIISILCKNS